MDKGLIDAIAAMFGGLILGLAAGCGMGGCAGSGNERARAVEAKVARWEVDPATGATTFVYGVLPAEKGGRP